MQSIRQFSKVLFLVLFLAFIATSCASTCKGGGWYAKDRNLGPKNKPIKYKHR